MIKKANELYGRQISANLIDSKQIDQDLILKRSPIKVMDDFIICKRCGQKSPKQIAELPLHNFYCPKCINLGRISTLNQLWTIKEPNYFNTFQKDPMTWDGKLTKPQLKCSLQVIKVFKKNLHHLLWAVTGAGKTEMLFNGINWGLKHQKRIAIASPRIDVCMELYPRLQAAFKGIDITLLHGHQKKPYQYCQMTICTTHQLLRFYHAFDILIIDEVDSFPFVHNQQLHYAASNAIKQQAALLYLTATPNPELLRLIHHHQMTMSYLPIRYHGHLLPEITLHIAPRWRNKIKHHQLPRLMISLLKNKIKVSQRFLLFVPHISDLKPVSKLISKLIDPKKFATVYSSDEKRLEKVQMMRQHQFQFLITTTILERGVTFPNIDVIILGADDEIFSTSSLVQIAGRVGRNSDRPFGDVDFICHSNSKNVTAAIKQIKHLNYLGGKLIEHH
ncbi:DEAD/DEAH box helicase [Philodulcilactobacillus myokoensis]|nr:helicase-related protein [Philodulcilactobacillus myokoensis]